MKTTTHEPPVLITEKETARLLGCCERSVWQMRKDGKIRCVKIGTAVRYARSEIDRFVESQMNLETTNEESTKKLIQFSAIQIAAIEVYAMDNGLTRAGKPQFSAAVRQLISHGLQLDMALHDVKQGRPFSAEEERVDADSTLVPVSIAH